MNPGPAIPTVSRVTPAPLGRVVTGSIGILGGSVSGQVNVGTVDTIKGGSIGILGQPIQIRGSVGILDGVINIGTVNVLSAISGTVDIEHIFRKNVLFDGTHIGIGSVLSSSFVNITKEDIKTVSAKLSGGNGLVFIDVSSNGTFMGSVGEFEKTDLVDDTFTFITFNDAFEFMRIRVQNNSLTSGTVFGILGRKT